MEVALGAGEANDAIAVLRDAMPFAGASAVLLAHCGALAAGAIRGRRAPSTAQTTLTDRNLLLSVRYRELKNFADKRLPITFQEPIVAGEGGGKKQNIHKTAKQIGLTISPNVLARADKVIK